MAALFNKDNASFGVVESLFAEQHRGQDSAGIVSTDGEQLYSHFGLGLVKDTFKTEILQNLKGKLAIGHVRYPTQGKVSICNCQPHIFKDSGEGVFALASNGDITNLPELAEEIRSHEIKIEGENDAEVIAKFIGLHHKKKNLSLVDAIYLWMEKAKGAYSAVLMTKNELYAFRDPWAFRPMCYGIKDDFVLVVSESVALDILRVPYSGEIPAGTIFKWDISGLKIFEKKTAKPSRHCIFEHIYFSRPDSIVFGEKVFEVRRKIGMLLAENDSVKADCVIAVPDSSNYIGLGYAEKRGLPFVLGLVRNHYVGRTFIAPDQITRDEGVRFKFNPLPSFFNGKKIILVDDSIVRGTTIKKLIRMLKENGALEVHLRIGSPPIRYSCFYGVDTPNRDKLIASKMDVEEIRKFIGADSLKYLPIEDLRKCVTLPDDYCYACFNGEYPAGEKKHPSLVS
ncbi:MAG: amidophosphoribosyltransferase [Acidobacteria bacterium]|nr:amidophosphoribosyltransferase [Acidobacteriota bacterium]